MSDEEKPAAKSLLTGLLENSDSTVKLITLGLIVVSGGSNFFATKEAARVSEKEARRAIDQIDDLHSQLNQTIERQKEMHALLEKMYQEKKDGSGPTQ